MTFWAVLLVGVVVWILWMAFAASFEIVPRTMRNGRFVAAVYGWPIILIVIISSSLKKVATVRCFKCPWKETFTISGS